MMDTTADDNFFIEEPHKLRNNFFSKDKSLQLVELLAQKHHRSSTTNTPVDKQQKAQQFHPYSISFMMKKAEIKPNSAEHLDQLLRKVQQTLDYREHRTIDRLSAVLDEHFVELVKTDDAGDIIDQLSAYVDSQCALLREIENTKSLLRPVADMLNNQHQPTRVNRLPNGGPSNSKRNSQKQASTQRIYHIVDYIDF